MRILMGIVVLLTLIGAAAPLQAQTPRRVFVEGTWLGEYYDSPPVLGASGGGVEFGVPVSEKQSPSGNTTTTSLRVRVDVLGGDHFYSFLIAPQASITRVVQVEVPIGFTFATSSGSGGAGPTFGLGIPIRLGDRLAIVPRGVAHLLFGSDGAGLWTVLGLGVRWRF
jgi:hypothetical protein